MKKVIVTAVVAVLLVSTAVYAETSGRAAGALSSPGAHAVATSPSKITPGNAPSTPVATETLPSKVGPGNMPSTPVATEEHNCPTGQIWWIDHCQTSPVSKPSQPDGSQPSNGPGPLPTPGSSGGGLGQQQQQSDNGNTPPAPGKACAIPSLPHGNYCVWPKEQNGKCPQGMKELKGYCYTKEDYKKAKKE
jgi:hypothetical protein